MSTVKLLTVAQAESHGDTLFRLRTRAIDVENNRPKMNACEALLHRLSAHAVMLEDYARRVYPMEFTAAESALLAESASL